MKKLIAILLTLVMTLSMSVNVSFACGTQDQWQIVYRKEPTCKTAGEAVIYCPVCNKYRGRRNSSSSWYWYGEGNKYINNGVYRCYKPYTLSYKAEKDGPEIKLDGEYHRYNISMDLYVHYLGETQSKQKLPDMPKTTTPVGYSVSPFSTTRYRVNDSQDPTKYSSYVPGNDANSNHVFLNEVDTNYVVVPTYAVAPVKVSLSQEGNVLKPTISNENKNLAYTYQWYKDGEVIEGETGETLTVEPTDTETTYKVFITANNASDSQYYVLPGDGYRSNTGEAEIKVTKHILSHIKIMLMVMSLKMKFMKD